jgi:hypothetical protein
MCAPGIPAWVKDLRAEGWANIYDIVPDPLRLTGVDAFCGDWRAHTLVVGKDCAPARVFRKRVSDGITDPYRHDPKLPTNRMLHETLKQVGVDAPLDGSRADCCGVFYANAFFLLRDDDRFSGGLPNRHAALEESKKVLGFILAHQPRLDRIVAMGRDAYDALSSLLGFQADWRQSLLDRRHVMVEGKKIVASSHLGVFGVRNRLPGGTREACRRLIFEDWRAAFGA